MNISMIKNSVLGFAYKTGIIQNAPEILMGVGIVAIGGGIVSACKGTLEVNKVIEKHKETVTLIRQTQDSPDYPEYDNTLATKDLAKTYVETGRTILKVYAPAFILATFGIGCFFKSHNILRARNVALVAAYKAVSESFQKYRERVIEEHGEETDKMYRLGIYQKDGKIIEKDENGKKQKIDVSELEYDENKKSKFAFLFAEESSSLWCDNRTINRDTIMGVQRHFNDVLMIKGWVSLNDILKALGCRQTSEGQIVGWIKKVDESGNMINSIDLGITDFRSFGGENRKLFMTLNEDAIWIIPNVEDVIFDKIDKVTAMVVD